MRSRSSSARTVSKTQKSRTLALASTLNRCYVGVPLRAQIGQLHLHWRLDVVFCEDDGRVAQRNAATNFATIRRLALNLVNHDPSEMSVAKKRYAATLDTDYLEEIIKA